MIYDGELLGKYVKLRTIEEKDAATTLKMRLDAEKTRFLHPVKDDINLQINWIKKSRISNNEYHFVVTDYDETIIGSLGISEITETNAHAGRLLFYGNSLQSFEAYLLVLRFGFDYLKLKQIWGDVDVNNKKSWRFTEMFGFSFLDPEYDPDMKRMASRCILDHDSFTKSEKRICSLIYRDK